LFENTWAHSDNARYRDPD